MKRNDKEEVRDI